MPSVKSETTRERPDSDRAPWRLSFCEALHSAFTKARFRRLGLPPMNKPVSA
jgi:hypothetical protein